MFNWELVGKNRGLGYVGVVAMTVALIGCSDNDGKIVQDSPVSATRDVEPSTLQGVWENKGYGRILSIEQGVTFDYQVNSSSCWLSGEYLPHELDGFLVEVRLAADEKSFDTLSEHIAEYAHPYTYSRLDALPDTCDESNIVRATDDPMANYNMLWQSMNDYYAFFDLREVDWNQVDQISRPRVSQIFDDAGLIGLFQEMLTPLRDGHVDLIAGELDYSWDAGFTSDWFQRAIDYFQQENPPEALQTAFEQQDEYVEFGQFLDVKFGQFFEILSEQQQENVASYLSTVQCEANIDICWGNTASNIGYLFIDRMASYQTTGVEPTTSADLSVLNTTLDNAFMTLSGTDAMIIDIRKNQGGEDRISLEIAGRFAEFEQVAFRKKSRYEGGFANEHDVMLVPIGERPYNKPVYLLVSGGSYSGAEVFALTMKQLPNVTLVGEPTGGILSDAISKTLPNGWEFSLSSEIYSDLEGQVYEGTGIPVDHDADFFVVENILAGRDLAIEWVLEMVIQDQMAQ